MSIRVFVFLLAALWAAPPALAAGPVLSGAVTDPAGAAVAGARVTARDIATGVERAGLTGQDGRYQLALDAAGTYLVVVTRAGFSESARTIVVRAADDRVDLPVQLEIGRVTSEVTVTAARAEREVRRIPLHIESITGDAIADGNTQSTGDALAGAANITLVGGGPFGARPRLRGLDSTRLLVLVDGERLNTARQATERTGAEVGLVPVDTIDTLEIVNGAGTLMYGSDALSGTINILTNEARFSPDGRWQYGVNGLYSGNEEGGRGTLTLGYSSPRFAALVLGGAEQYGNYRAGAFDVEDTQPLFDSGVLTRADTIDDAFGFTFGAFPDPFNAPYRRTSREVPNSAADGSFVNASGLVSLTGDQRLRARFQRRRMQDIGFPDFADPYFFNATSLPWSNLDRASIGYEAAGITPWLANVSVTAHYQRTERLLRNLLPIQFPAPTPQVFFPISVMRLDVLSETEQRVWTPGLDVRAVFVPSPSHLVTTGFTAYQDRSGDRRTTSTSASLVGQVALGPRGPAAIVFPSRIPLGGPSVAHPVRVPDARLRDIAVFAQDEWRVAPRLSIMAGVRADFYGVTTKATPGYDVGPVVAGAVPAIDPATLPSPAGASVSRRALTGDVGLVANAGGSLTPFLRVGRSYRHPNLEELLFAGPATVGVLAPNITLAPETGVNVDAGATFRAGRVSGGVYAFTNRYRNFIAQDLVVGRTPSGPLAQSTNYAGVRISGLEASADAPVVFRRGVLTLSGSGALTRGTIASGFDPSTGTSLAGTPADNITPAKLVASARWTEGGGRWWVEYGVRAQSEVTRVAVTLLESPFLIAQDLLSLDGFAVHRLGAGLLLTRGPQRLRLSLSVDNLTDAFYREHFQFAPARGRSVSVGLSVGAF
ncbi:MAG TPA: TonB-dependent receptor [Vicinamibacterales bacterium]